MRVTMRTFQQAVRGLPDLRNAPQTMDFTVRGQTFTADVTPDPDGGSCATVRGRGDGFTEADTLLELRKGHAEVISARDVRTDPARDFTSERSDVKSRSSPKPRWERGWDLW